jgi:hypothetical protein
VVSSLEEIDPLVRDAVHQPVFLSDAPGPAAGEDKFQWLGLTRSFERIPHDGVNEIQDPDRHTALVFDPKPQILKKLGLKYGRSLRLSLHRASLFAMPRPSRV